MLIKEIQIQFKNSYSLHTHKNEIPTFMNSYFDYASVKIKTL